MRPIILSETVTLSGSDVTDYVVNMPATRPDGDVYLVIIAKDGTGAITQPGGNPFTALSSASSGASLTAAFWRTGSSEPASYTFTGASENYVAVVYRLKYCTGFESGTSNTGASTTPTSAAYNTSQDEVLNFWACGSDDDDETPAFAPTDYVPRMQEESASTTTSCLLGVATKFFPTSGTSVAAAVGALAASEDWTVLSLGARGLLTAAEVTSWDAAHPAYALDEEASVIVAGKNFGALQLTGKIEIWSNLTGSTKVEQTVSSWADTSITITANRGSIAEGRMYLVVTTTTGLVSEPFRIVVLDTKPDYRFEHKRVALNTSGTPQSITIAGESRTPKFVLVMAARATADGRTDQAAMGFGMAVSTTERGVVCFSSIDNAATSDTNRRGDTTDLLLLLGGTTVELRADLGAFVAGGCEIAISTFSGSAYIADFIFGFGTLMQADVANILEPAPLNIEQIITAPAFDPDLIIPIHVGGSQVDANQSFAIPTMGFWHNKGPEGPHEMAVGSWNALEDNLTTQSLTSFIRNDLPLCQTSTSAVSYQVLIDSTWADRDIGYRLRLLTGTPGTDEVLSLALALPGLQIKVAGLDAPTATGTRTITSVGFRSQMRMQWLSRCASFNAIEADADANAMAISITTASSQESWGCSGNDGVAGNTDAATNVENKSYFLRDAAGVIFEADFTAFTTDGWTDEFTTVDATQRRFIYLAIEDPAGGAVSVTQTDGIKLGDAPVSLAAGSGVASEGAKLGDAPIALAAGFGILSDGGVFGDAPIVLALGTGVVAEGALLGDAPVAFANVLGIVVEGLKVGDLAAGARLVAVVTTEGILAADTLLELRHVPTTLSEGLLAGDAALGIASALGSAVEGLKGGDAAPIGLATALGVLLEGAKYGDFLVAVASASAAVAEGLKAGEEWAALAAAQGVLADAVRLGDSPAALAAAIGAAAEGGLFGDATTSFFDGGGGENFDVVAADTAQYGDAAVALAVALGIASEGTRLGDAPVGKGMALGTLLEGSKFGDAYVGAAQSLGVVFEGAKYGDAYMAVCLAAAAQVAAVGFHVELAALATAAVSLAEGTRFGDSLLASTGRFGTTSEGIQLSDTAVGISQVVGIVLEGIRLSDTVVGRAMALASVLEGGRFGDFLAIMGTKVVLGVLEVLVRYPGTLDVQGRYSGTLKGSGGTLET